MKPLNELEMSEYWASAIVLQKYQCAFTFQISKETESWKWTLSEHSWILFLVLFLIFLSSNLFAEFVLLLSLYWKCSSAAALQENSCSG